MFKIKKRILFSITIIYLILTFIEFIIYLFNKSNLFGVVYLIISLLMIFFIIPTLINYSEKYSNVRVSKIIVFIIIGIFCSYFLMPIIISSLNYIDCSNRYGNSIFLIKNILKNIIYFLYLIFLLIELNIFNKIRNFHIK